jgi:hypothetical protein
MPLLGPQQRYRLQNSLTLYSDPPARGVTSKYNLVLLVLMAWALCPPAGLGLVSPCWPGLWLSRSWLFMGPGPGN